MNHIKHCFQCRSLLFSLSFFFVVLFSCVNLHAQNFGDGNPIWNYSVSSGWGGLSYHLQMTVKKDTTFKGKQCKILTSGKTGNPNYMPYKNMICQDSNKVVFWSPTLSKFQTLYDFEAVKGDYWSLKLDGYTLYSDKGIYFMIVDSVYYDTINNIRVKVQDVRTRPDTIPNEFYSDSLTVFESIGCTQFLFPWYDDGVDGDMVHHLRCFEDDAIGFYRFDHEVACDYTQVGIDQLNETTNISIYPNPVTANKVQLKGLLSSIVYNISVLNLNGQVVKSIKYKGNESLNLSGLNVGVYNISVSLEDNIIAIKKLVISE